MRLDWAVIRFASGEDVARMIAIEVASGELFRGVGMDAIADDDPGTPGELARALDSGIGWVATDGDRGGNNDVVTGYLLAESLDELLDEEAGRSLFIAQVTVDPVFGRRGIGAALIETAAEWARSQGLDALALTTFRDVPWNRAYYERLGFEVVGAEGWSTSIRERVAQESARGIDAWPRVVMFQAIR
jgi:GNAT superfamily N-acetyltransferase